MRHTAGFQQYGALSMPDDDVLNGETAGCYKAKSSRLAFSTALSMSRLYSDAHVTAMLVVIGFRYAATLQEFLRPQPAAFARADGLRHGKHHVTDTQVLFRAYRDIPRGRLEVHEVGEVAARQALEYQHDAQSLRPSQSGTKETVYRANVSYLTIINHFIKNPILRLVPISDFSHTPNRYDLKRRRCKILSKKMLRLNLISYFYVIE